jgi:DNA invertase Pin-like site-specific DNA recombinase
VKRPWPPRTTPIYSGWLEVDFLAVDNPHATKFNLHILAAVAEFERDAVSKRTTEALAAAKARGLKLGNYARIAAAKQAATRARVESVRPMIVETAHLSLQGAADALKPSAMNVKQQPPPAG